MFGITDHGEIIGQDVPDSTLKNISHKIRQKIKPEITPEITITELNKNKIIKVIVKEGNNKPYRILINTIENFEKHPCIRPCQRQPPVKSLVNQNRNFY